jgi:hypothetical protein
MALYHLLLTIELIEPAFSINSHILYIKAIVLLLSGR